MGLAHTFYYSPIAETRDHFVSVFRALYPSEGIVTVSSWEELNGALAKHRFLCYILSIPQDDPQLKELLFDLRTVNPSAKLMVTCPSAISAELELLSERLHLDSILTEPIEPESLADAYDGPPSSEEASFAGRIRLSLPEIIQLFCHGRRQTALQVKTMRDEGKIFFEKGEIVHCRTNMLQGLDAMYAMLSWRSGRFLELPAETAPERNVHLRWERILMESAQRLDEVSSLENCAEHDGGDVVVPMSA